MLNSLTKTEVTEAIASLCRWSTRLMKNESVDVPGVYAKLNGKVVGKIFESYLGGKIGLLDWLTNHVDGIDHITTREVEFQVYQRKFIDKLLADLRSIQKQK